MRTIWSLAIAAILAAPGHARADDLPPLRSLQPPFFTADVAVALDSLTHPTVNVTLTVPYTELSWNRVPSGFAAGAGFTVELEPERRDRLYGGSWEKRVLIESYAATRSSRSNLSMTRAFELPPGRYKVRVRVRDVSSEQESGAEDLLVVEDLARVPAGFGDMQLGLLDSTGAFLPVPGRAFGYEVDRLAARVTTFDRRPGPWPRRALVHWRLLDEGGDVEVQGDTTFTLSQPSEHVILRPAARELFLGRHTLELERVEGRARWRASRAFDVEESGPPRGREWTQMLEALSYIAPNEEVEGLRNLPADQQPAGWDRFWRRRDPTPETPRNEFQIEFFRRMRYADQHFQGFGPGWRSDMGRIYIRFGPPDQIEQHPASTSTPITEVWYYNQPYRRFVFVDREGFGRFTLAQPFSE